MSSIIPKNFQDIYVKTITPLISTSANISATNITATNLIVTTATIPNIVLTGSLNARFNSNTLGNLFTTAGNVGINSTSPSAQLDIFSINTYGNIFLGNNQQNRKLVLYDVTGNNTGYFGFGINTNILRYQTSTTADDHVFYASSNELFRIKGTGNIIVAGTTNSVSLSSGNIFSTNISSTNLVATTSTIPNAVFTNITTISLLATTSVSSAGLFSTNATSTNIVGTTSTIPNAVFTNITTVSLLATTSVSSAGLFSTNITSTNIVGTTSTIPNIIHTNITTNTLLATTQVSSSNIYSTNVTSTNIVGTNITSTNIYGTNISTGLLDAGLLRIPGFGRFQISNTNGSGTAFFEVYGTSGQTIPLVICNNNAATTFLTIATNGNISTNFNLDVAGIIDSTSITSGALYSTNITSTNIVGTNSSITNLRINGGIYAGPTNFTTVGGGNLTNLIFYPEAVFDSNVNGFPSKTANSVGNAIALRVRGNDDAVMDFGVNGGSGSWIQTTNYGSYNLNYPLLLNPNGGNVGINTSSPNFTLDIIGSTRAIGTNYVGNPNNTADNLGLFVDGNNNGLGYRLGMVKKNGSPPFFATNNITSYVFTVSNTTDASQIITNSYSTIMTLSTLGNLTITGTSNSVSVSTGNLFATNVSTNTLSATTSLTSGGLMVNGNGQLNMINTGDARINVRDFSGNMISFYQSSTKVGGVTGVAANQSLTLNASSNTNQIFLGSTGNIGIGTTDPSITLSVNGGIQSRTFSTISGTTVQVQGLHLQWNRSGADGESWIINQLGGGTANAGIRFGKSNTANVVTEQMRIQENGNVGINTTAPNYTLDVNGTTRILNNSIGGIYLGSSTGTANFSTFLVSSTGSLEIAIAAGAGSFANNSVPGDIIFRSANDNIFIGTSPTGGNLYLATSGNIGLNNTSPSYRLDVSGTARINTTRGILIGTSADIDSGRMISALNSGLPSGSTSYITLGVSASQNNQAEYAFTYTSTGSVLNCASIGVFGGDVRLNVNRNTVSIGTTTNSTSKLVIYESTGTAPSGIAGSLFIQRGNTGGSSSIVFPAVSNINSDYGFIQYIDSVANAGFTSYNYFGGTGTEVAALLIGCENDGAIGSSGSDSVIISPIGNVAITPKNNTTYISGNVGINNTAPTSTLHVAGTTYFTSSANNAFGFNCTNSTNNSCLVISNSIGQTSFIGQGGSGIAGVYNNNLFLQSPNSTNFFTNSGTNTLFLGTSGNVGINNTAPSGPLQIGSTALFSSNGNLTCTGDVLAYGSISDQRLKTNIETIPPEIAINTVKQLNPVTFNWKENVFNTEKQNKFDSGFIAQEVEAILEHATGEYTHIESGTIYKNLKHERIIPYLLRTVQSLLERVELLENNF
jgi:hypothetical protein